MIAASLQAALAQLPDPTFRAVLLRGVGITLAALLTLTAAIGFGVSLIGVVELPFVGAVEFGTLAGAIAAFAVLLASSFLMIPVAAAVIGFFLEDIARAVEAEHYPHLRPAAGVPLGTAMADAARFFGIVIGANLVALIFYILFAPFAPFIFYGLNGYLLGREYFGLVALRRQPPAEVKALLRRHRAKIWGLGVLLALPLSIPLFGLLVPLIGVAAFTHLYHQLAEQAG